MANQKHLDILKQGIGIWNAWRASQPDLQPDLTDANLREGDFNGANFKMAKMMDADLRRADLIGTDFTEANLKEADLRDTDLRKANFNMANLFGVDFSRADLIRANLKEANLTSTNLSFVNLREADLSGANLYRANLNFAYLSEANLSQAIARSTIFGDVDLSTVKGLETVNHLGPSIIGIDTIYRSQGNIPEVFLKGAGVDDTFITYIRSLIGKAIEYYSCFISYSSKDDAFARRLYTDLQNNNVRCWFAPEDLKWGERIRTGIDEAISMHDKLLLILSKHSVNSGWVEREVKTALAKERKEKRTVLFPVRVDMEVFESPFDWATEIRHERNIGDFTRWKNHDDYEKAFSRLLRDLKAEAQKMGS